MNLVQDFLRVTSDPDYLKSLQKRIKREMSVEVTEESRLRNKKMNEQYREYKKSLKN